MKNLVNWKKKTPPQNKKINSPSKQAFFLSKFFFKKKYNNHQLPRYPIPNTIKFTNKIPKALTTNMLMISDG